MKTIKVFHEVTLHFAETPAILEQLELIKEQLNKMNEKEQILDEKLDDAAASLDALKERANTAISLVQQQNDTLTRLVADLKANAPDLTDEIETVDNLIAATNAFLSDQPPTDQPPTDQPPTDQPPTDQPPTDQPPTDQPPTDQPPTDQPPTDQPPTDEKPTDGDNGESADTSDVSADGSDAPHFS